MDLSVNQIVPRLADKGIYLCSESSMYRIMRRDQLLTHRIRSVKPKRHKGKLKYIATKPNEIWVWDITLLRALMVGTHYYLYLVEDIYSRKILDYRVEDRECSTYSSQLIENCISKEKIIPKDLRLHSDNGVPMKSSTMLATLHRLGVVPSFSRPCVSNDNPHVESLFRTLKYRPEYPYKPFKSLEEARIWVDKFINWYNHHHLHSGLSYVTPNDRHTGSYRQILAKRSQVYCQARRNNPQRWSGGIRTWNINKTTALNPYGVRAA